MLDYLAQEPSDLQYPSSFVSCQKTSKNKKLIQAGKGENENNLEIHWG